MADSPWHPEILHREENDPRRHRSRCIHYESNSKKCKYRLEKCVGSAHCLYYKEHEDLCSQGKCNEQISKKCASKCIEERKIAVPSIKTGDRVYHKVLGFGTVERIDEQTRQIHVMFSNKASAFIYPEIFIKGLLTKK